LQVVNVENGIVYAAEEGDAEVAEPAAT